ncbi:hypothetical protein ACOMHN_035590 [Nucella lapillus]
MKDLEQTLSDLYYYFGGSKSGNRKCELEEIQKILNDPVVKIKECHEIRWISFFEAVRAVFSCWASLVTYFSSREDSRSKGLYRKLSDYKFPAVLAILMDILPSLAQLSMVLQKQDLDIACVQPALNGLKNKLKTARSGKAHYQIGLLDKLVKEKNSDGEIIGAKYKKKQLRFATNVRSSTKEIEEIRVSFCDNLTKNIEDRFPRQSTDVASAFGVLGMRPMSFLSADERAEYGLKELSLLTDFYGQKAVKGASASLEDSDDLSSVGSQACSMMSLVRHYTSLCKSIEADGRGSPKKSSSPKKRRLETDPSPSPSPPPAIAIILEDVENFSPTVLQDFIVTCSNYADRLPIVLVLGVATSVSAVHRLLPTAVSSLLCMEKFQIPPSTHYLSLVIDKILMTNKYPFKLGPKVFQLLLDMFLCHHFSVLNFVTAFQYCMMEHYSGAPLSQLCCPQDWIPRVVRKLSSREVQRLQQLPSVMRHIEQLPRPQLAGILQSEDNFKKLIQQLLEQSHEAHHRSGAILQLVHSLTSHLPGRPLGKQIRELYAQSLEKDLEETEGFTRAFELLGLTARDELTSLVTNCTSHMEHSEDKCLTEVRTQLDHFVYRLNHLKEEHVEEAENPTEGKDLKLQRTDLRSLQKKLQEMSKKKRVSPYERVRQELLTEVKDIVRTYLRKCESMVLYEVMFYDDAAAVKQHLYASPRSAIHQALSNPAHYLQCACCEADDGSILSTMPDVCIAYKLHLECGQLINLYDWLQAFASIVTAEDRENKKPSKPDKVLQARFIQAVSELQFLGFIKPTKRKTDHVARLTWGGC